MTNICAVDDSHNRGTWDFKNYPKTVRSHILQKKSCLNYLQAAIHTITKVLVLS